MAKNERDKSRDLQNPSLKMKLIFCRKKGSRLQSFKRKGVKPSLNQTTPYKFSKTHSLIQPRNLFFWDWI